MAGVGKSLFPKSHCRAGAQGSCAMGRVQGSSPPDYGGPRAEPRGPAFDKNHVGSGNY